MEKRKQDFLNPTIKENPLKIILLAAAFAIGMGNGIKAQTKYVTIQGTVADYAERPIEGASVFVQDENFKDLYQTKTDGKGHYRLKIPKGKYPYLSAIREENYANSPRFNGKVDEAKLEFWSWGFVADKDTTLNIHYDKMEVYGVHVFRVRGAGPYLNIFARPMSIQRTIRWMAQKTPAAHLAPTMDRLKVEVFVDGEAVKVVQKQPLAEYVAEGQTMDACLITVAEPKNKPRGMYRVFRVVMEDLDNGDKGEALYYDTLQECTK